MYPDTLGGGWSIISMATTIALTKSVEWRGQMVKVFGYYPVPSN